MTATTYTQHVGNPTVRAYLAGTAASTALVAAAVVVFLSLATFVAFNQWPFGNGDTSEAAVSLGGADSAVIGPAEAAAAAAAAAPAAVGPKAIEPGLPTQGAPADPGGPLYGEDPIPPPVSPEPEPPISPPPGVPGMSYQPIGGLIGNVDGTTGSLGLDRQLGPLTGDLTGSLDEGLIQTLDGVGKALGTPALGTRVAGATDALGRALLGEEGLSRRLTQPPEPS